MIDSKYLADIPATLAELISQEMNRIHREILPHLTEEDARIVWNDLIRAREAMRSSDKIEQLNTAAALSRIKLGHRSKVEWKDVKGFQGSRGPRGPYRKGS